MKALTDKIIDCLRDRRKCFIGNLRTKESVAKSEGFREGLMCAIGIIEALEQQAEFDEIARVMMKHMGDRTDLYCPHHYVFITSTTAELMQGQRTVGQVTDYIKD